MFITFEGTEGSGKTSQLHPTADFLRQQGRDVLTLREPGGTSIGEQIRKVLFNLENTEMHPRTEILLFQASRAQLVEDIITPHLRKGGVVLCDRYADSTLAYQGFGYQLDLEPLRALIAFATHALKPDLTLLFDLDVEVGMRRRASGGEWNRLDAYDLAFYQRVREGYHQLAREEPARWVIINAEQPPGQVQEAVCKAIVKRLRQKSG
ncbi:MAG: dTMP kinase [Anaerolineales bacterium]|nr:MAG: dTMP kinase [Anaerolineales bacterium]